MTRQLDKIDAEHIRETVETQGYRLIVDRLQARLDALVVDLCTDQSVEKTAKTRGQITEIKTILGLPERLIKEANANPAKDR